jgi:hypothetical protein
MNAMKTKTAKARILRVTIEHKQDESPDTSCLGEYQSNYSDGEYYLDRETGELKLNGETVAEVWTIYGRNEHRYITDFQHDPNSPWAHVDDKGVNEAYLNCRYRLNRAHENKRGNLFAKYKVKGWETAATRREKIRVLDIVYCCEDAYRLERLQRGDWYYVGIIAKAEVTLANDVTQTIRSGGLWGIESDCEDYHKQVEKEQLSELREQLEAIGFGPRAISYAFKNIERKI